MFEIGAVIRYVGDYDPYFPTEDVTLGKTYIIEGYDEDGAAFFIDDVGDRNFAAGYEADGCFGIFEEVEED